MVVCSKNWVICWRQREIERAAWIKEWQTSACDCQHIFSDSKKTDINIYWWHIPKQTQTVKIKPVRYIFEFICILPVKHMRWWWYCLCLHFVCLLKDWNVRDVSNKNTDWELSKKNQISGCVIAFWNFESVLNHRITRITRIYRIVHR